MDNQYKLDFYYKNEYIKTIKRIYKNDISARRYARKNKGNPEIEIRLQKKKNKKWISIGSE